MDLYIIIAIIIANGIALGMIYRILRKLPKKEILVFMAMSIATVYILVSLVYLLSGIGIDKSIHEATKSFVTYLFVPINAILFIPYLAIQYKKTKEKKMKTEELIKKTIIVGILLVIVLIVEYFYFSNIQKNIVKINVDKNQNNSITTNTIIQNEQIKNNIANEVKTNNI